MTQYDLLALTCNSKEQIEDVILLEQKCKQHDQINISAGIEHLVKENGDKGLLCYYNNEMIGLLSWYTSDGISANINGMVNPDYRRQRVFSSLLTRAKEDIKKQGIQKLIYRVHSGSLSGLKYVEYLGAEFDRSEYLMQLSRLPSYKYSRDCGLLIYSMQPQDFEFVISCSSLAFGDSEAWTREYFTKTNEPNRTTYIALSNHERVGLIRINHLNDTTSIIHDFCVHPSYQGNGIGKEILLNTVEKLLEEGYTNIKLSVVTENHHALNLYRNVGFEVTSELQYFIGTL
ncbi:GNAT family N-acetyltransferase [Neobacillus sp. MM2021_6]|uniref:GNAT family N-acetyltransferase n=1 Tax=Bacillaceae TaxID=186817 RepID=UPI0014097FDC|nr:MULTISPECIES: GNAT family N-acetyltransferase [Bacillaceae]MBO0960879.1 GNAT family N-acetyltransferase [Neobacillus sp. MM2021_6]NHC21161.1 GNAT family N-acetyltransferase [Bacillus sp. MM2020_4]